jgi:hypothetical protein
LCLEPKRRYKRLVSKTKSSPAKSKEGPVPKARTPSASTAGVADVLASVHAKAKVLSEALP